ncbi:prepilin-type N-terminal cleavage/methylation domain-containing protein [unidentified bacterial endosymbiont]|uniref:prepilin-type N-terminal cleavage/methylation domain-containing protein n=1 Tax=unidentified bacterial endosymbiont TaxID=2355 RepID=UPI00209E1101|nr:prepilin-type N-terminal cleavage/methylation domain-containing protein [unidentified bacterial endosymbiont]
MPIGSPKASNQYGMLLLELPFMLLITALMFKVLWCYHQQLQRQFLQIEWRQQAWQLVYYSLEAAGAQQGEAVHRPPLPSVAWKRRWHRSPLLADCQRLTVTISRSAAVQAQLSAVYCPAPPVVTTLY